jgi:dTDP-4-amino-4,6-dideoxy-D-galactose acyltransferase
MTYCRPTGHPYRLLGWDSDFFGFGVARITAATVDTSALEAILAALRKQGVVLAYWSTDPRDMVAQEAARHNRGWLADEKTTFVIGLEKLRDSVVLPTAEPVREYASSRVDAALYRLALQSGVHSRFFVDPRFPRSLFEKLYREWIRKSVTRVLAKSVLVAGSADQITGMVTVGEKNGRGDIGLVAVDSASRGRGIGRSLVGAALGWFALHAYSTAQVVTQRANTQACQLYLRCGFAVESVENFFHFWL